MVGRNGRRNKMFGGRERFSQQIASLSRSVIRLTIHSVDQIILSVICHSAILNPRDRCRPNRIAHDYLHLFTVICFFAFWRTHKPLWWSWSFSVMIPSLECDDFSKRLRPVIWNVDQSVDLTISLMTLTELDWLRELLFISLILLHWMNWAGRPLLGRLFGCVAQWLERRSLTGELSLPSARSAADVWPLNTCMWVY